MISDSARSFEQSVILNESVAIAWDSTGSRPPSVATLPIGAGLVCQMTLSLPKNWQYPVEDRSGTTEPS